MAVVRTNAAAEAMAFGPPIRFAYQHVVQLNDARLALPTLTRAQVWQSLAGRAAHPDRYDSSITDCVVSGGGPRYSRRYARHGSPVADEALLEPGDAVNFMTVVPVEFRGSTLRISIDEPAPGALFLRFAYQLRGHATPLAAQDAAALREAYRHADLDFVRCLRELAPR